MQIPLAELFLADGDDYSFKWWHFSLQDTASCLLKDNLSRHKRLPLANASEAS